VQRRGQVDTITIRSRLMLEAASALAGDDEFPYRQARISFRAQGRDDGWPLTLLASDTPDAIDEVGRGEVHVAIVNPAAPLALAYRGAGPYSQPLPVRLICVIPSEDQMGFAVRADSRLQSLADLGQQHYPLRISLRRENHSSTFVAREVLAATGVSFDDIVAWGGQVRFDGGLPDLPNRWGAYQQGEVDAIFDEAMNRWADLALGAGLRFLPIDEPVLDRLATMGFRKTALSRANHPGLSADVPTVDFSGWPVFCHADVPEDWVYRFCAGLDARRDRIPWQGEGPLPLERMCVDSSECPIDLPFHAGAERLWRERGYL
jgi:TRAP-type uncharacterized transport system substrate-binding protein